MLRVLHARASGREGSEAVGRTGLLRDYNW